MAIDTMITIYGRIYSRAPRVLWLAEELGIDYQHVATDHKTGDTQHPDYLAVNPNGKIPCLVDGDVRIFESMAINYYLAEKFGGPLWPTDPVDRASVMQWSFWGMTEIEPHVISLFVEYVRKPSGEEDAAAIDHARMNLNRMFAVLNESLAEQDHLLGNTFTLADLNLASITALYTFIGESAADLLNEFPHAKTWLHDRCLARPAYQKVMSMAPPPADLPHLHGGT